MTQSAAAEEIAAEQRHLDRVYARLEVIKKEAAAAETAGYRLSRVGTAGSLVERDAMVYHASRRRRLLDAHHDGLVFGRLDLREGTVRHVGRIGLRDARARPLVIDWRAPAAAPYYRATAVDPLGVIRRRMISTSGERVTGVEDDLLDPEAGAQLRVIGDGALVASLAQATGARMRDIVASIQREQDEAIRSPALGATVVRGGPGTGKTAVALHRAAYLLYADRQRFASGGVLVVGPSPVFVTYIARVLPALGEDDVTLRSIGAIVPGVRASRTDPARVAAVKGSLRMAKLLGRVARAALPGAPGELRLLYGATLLRLDTVALDRLRASLLGAGARRNAVRPRAAGLVLDALWRQARELLGESAVPPRAEFAADVAERAEFIRFMRAWWPRLRPAAVLGFLADRRRLAGWSAGLLTRDEVSALADSLSRLATLGPTVADVALLDELDDLLGSPPQAKRPAGEPFMVGGVRELTTFADRIAAARAVAVARPDDYRGYAHIVVDEAQDVSPMQWRMLARRGEYASWTVVGDPAQSAWLGDPAELRRAQDAALAGRRRSEHVLMTNYRNPVEIFSVAAAVIRTAEPRLELPVSVRPGGADPIHLVVSEEQLPAATGEAATALLDEVEGTVGVIVAQARHDQVAGWLTGHDPRLSVVTGLEAKGMEYDGVLVVGPDEIAAESVRTLYVALSRATARLTTLATSPGWLPGHPAIRSPVDR